MAAGQPSTATGAAAPTGALYALAAGASGGSGSFSATSLSPSGSWEGGGPSGDFTWSYPLRTPPSLGGPTPSLSLSYSAQSVDGRTAATNNQPSWVGEGFDMWSGYIERSYRSCGEDMRTTSNNKTKTGDECWVTDNATMTLNGKTVELIKADSGDAWHPRQDDGSRIQHLTDTSLGNGDNDGEYWKVTTPNGTQYWFGRNRIPGWTSGARQTNSVWTAPVFGNDAGEPCNKPTFDASYCDQAWRWNLDYVVDPHGNSMSYWYTKELNNYGRDLTSTAVSQYVRGGTLDEIHYGTREGITSGPGSNLGVPPMQVTFANADRCVAGKDCSAKTPTSWPDVPWDQSCTSTTSCTQTGPTFFTQKRLSTITTQVLSGTALRNVERWTLNQSYRDPGDSTRAGLWLAGISHVGLDVPAGQPATTLPDVTFDGVQMSNRVDTPTDQRPAMNWWRISSISTETGGKIGVAYAPAECVAGTHMPSSADSNTMRCYPVRWTPDGYTDPITDWFHKYVVSQVTETDQVGASPDKVTSYEYDGGGAWHYTDDNGVITTQDKTWSVWRGYGRVKVTEGTGADATTGETLYFRGMNSDKTSSGSKNVQLTDSQGGTWPDSDPFSGMARETRRSPRTAPPRSPEPSRTRGRPRRRGHARSTATRWSRDTWPLAASTSVRILTVAAA
ncbi:hypothetical protein [Fodinicola feengrottensis]|uniref:hypothetical protein n=1 Tax=Fodinicola feengrottensis TaxID=435914 RepID=UPI0013D34905|nr:hypothetical protein [Fodinicola feengrottensis]